MTPRGVRVAGIGIAGAARAAAGERDLAAAAGWDPRPGLSLDPEGLARAFPGRWNPRRALPEGLDRLVGAFAGALAEAGWWRPAQAVPVAGGLVLGTDSLWLASAWAFARELEERGPVGASPTGFLFSLPSSATSVLGILFGLREYQATVTEGGESGLRAVAHAVDLLQAGRLERAAVGALSVAGAGPGASLALGRELEGEAWLDLGVALALEAVAGDPGAAARVLPHRDRCCILDSLPPGAPEDLGGEIDPALRGLAAPRLLRFAQAIHQG